MKKPNTTPEQEIACALKRARDFEARRHKRVYAEEIKEIVIPQPPGSPRVEIITPEQLMARLQVKRSWITEKRRRGCLHPLPAQMSKPLRFNWYAILTWLEEEAQADSRRFAQPRPPVRAYHRKQVRSK